MLESGRASLSTHTNGSPSIMEDNVYNVSMTARARGKQCAKLSKVLGKVLRPDRGNVYGSEGEGAGKVLSVSETVRQEGRRA